MEIIAFFLSCIFFLGTQVVRKKWGWLLFCLFILVPPATLSAPIPYIAYYFVSYRPFLQSLNPTKELIKSRRSQIALGVFFALVQLALSPLINFFSPLGSLFSVTDSIIFAMFFGLSASELPSHITWILPVAHSLIVHVVSTLIVYFVCFRSFRFFAKAFLISSLVSGVLAAAFLSAYLYNSGISI
jgi:hypothetical protein